MDHRTPQPADGRRCTAEPSVAPNRRTVLVIGYLDSCVLNGMPVNPYTMPTTALTDAAGRPLRRHLIYFAIPVMVLVVPVVVGVMEYP